MSGTWPPEKVKGHNFYLRAFTKEDADRYAKTIRAKGRKAKIVKSIIYDVYYDGDFVLPGFWLGRGKE